MRKEMSAETKTAIHKVLAKHDDRHAMHGGHGVSCFVWVNGSVFTMRNSLRLDTGVENDLREITGVLSTKINVD